MEGEKSGSRGEQGVGDSGVLEPKHIRAALVDQAKVGGL